MSDEMPYSDKCPVCEGEGETIFHIEVENELETHLVGWLMVCHACATDSHFSTWIKLNPETVDMSE